MSADAIDKSALLELGNIAGIWGVRGWVKVFSYTRNRVEIGEYQHWLIAPKSNIRQIQQYKVLNCREQGQGIVAQLDGVTDRDQAKMLIGSIIYINQADLPVLPRKEYYWHQLIGLEAQSINGENLGEVASMLETGANDVLVIKQGETEMLIPYMPEVVKKVDLEKNLIEVEWDNSYLQD